MRAIFHHRAIRALILAFFLLAGAVSVVNPLFEATDEIRHYRYIRTLVVEHRLPVQGGEVRAQSHHPPLYYLLSALVSGWVPSPHTATYQHPRNPFWGYHNWEVGVDNKVQYLHVPAERFPFRQGFLAAMIPRWVNVLLGAVTVALTYALGRRLWPAHASPALAAAAMVAFNPQFIYLSAAMNNDIAAAAVGTAVLLTAIVTLQVGATQRQRLILGLLYGLALLTKLHLAVLGAVIAVALAMEARRAEADLSRSLRRWAGGMTVVLGVAGLLAGWWFIRNWQLYGDPTGMRKLNELWYGRPARGNWWALWQGLPYLWSSLWGRFGYGQIPLPTPLYWGIGLACAVGLLGLVTPRPPHLPRRERSLLAFTIALFLTVVSYYILIQPAGAMGRFLFPALPAFTLLVAGGWGKVSGRPLGAATLVTAGMLALAGEALGGYLWPAVRYPPAATPPAVSLDVRFGDVARLLAVEVTPTELHPGETVRVRVTWEPLRSTARPYAVFVHLVDEAGVLIAQRDTWPGLGRAPTTVWRPGRLLEDEYRVELPASVYAPVRAEVHLGLYEPTRGRLPPIVGGEAVAGDGSLTVGSVEVRALPGPWPNPQQANFGDEIALVGYTIAPRSLAAGETLTLTLYWQTLHPPRYDYLVFAQVIGEDYHVWGSHDGGGVRWTAGAVVTDVRHITLLPDTPAGSYPIQVGLFHGETGRLPLVAPDGRLLDNRLLLGPIRVYSTRTSHAQAGE